MTLYACDKCGIVSMKCAPMGFCLHCQDNRRGNAVPLKLEAILQYRQRSDGCGTELRLKIPIAVTGEPL